MTHEETDQTTPEAGPETGQGTGYKIQRFPEKIAVVRLPPGADIPDWAESSSLFSITATATETSLVCAGRNVPTKALATRGLIGFSLDEEVAPTSVGVVLALLGPMAEEDIAVYTFTTYDSTWVLVPSADADRAGEAWRRHGHTVDLAVPVKPSSQRAADGSARKK
ncbi:hypothetical protein BH11ACT8_BH11ACT8_22600 [soil metagenome]